MKKETMDKLDKINLIWVFENISVGNIMRGIMYVVNCVERCLTAMAKEIRTAVEEEDKKREETK